MLTAKVTLTDRHGTGELPWGTQDVAEYFESEGHGLPVGMKCGRVYLRRSEKHYLMASFGPFGEWTFDVTRDGGRTWVNIARGDIAGAVDKFLEC